MSDIAPEIVVLASGGGSNFQAIIDQIEKGCLNARIRCLITDRNCKAIQIAKQHDISYYIIDPKNDAELNLRVAAILCNQIDLIVLAGYLSILCDHFLRLHPNKIINIHPSLLPLYGGKGMYGIHVHQAVINEGERETGCTVHYVDTGIDTGEIVAQKTLRVSSLDTAESLQKKVLKLEHELLPETIRNLLPYQELI